jgi:hypothetical protein
METSKCWLASRGSFSCEDRGASTFSWSGLYMEVSWCEQKETSLCEQKENNAPGLLPVHRSLMFSLAVSAEDRALRGRNPSAA